MKSEFLIYFFCLFLISTSCKKKGCTDYYATNYSAEAEKDDGSCNFQTTIKTVSYGSDAIQTMTVYLPVGHDENTKTVVMVHGGGWFVGYNETDKVTTFDGRYGWDILNKMLDEGYACAVMKYRTACYTDDPTSATNNTHLYLDRMLEDVDLAIQKLKSESTSLGISNSHFQLLGESAGSHIVLTYGVSDQCDPAVKSVVSMFGPTAIDAYDWKYNLFQIDSTVPEGVLVDGINYCRTKDNACELQNNVYLHLQNELRSLGDADTFILNGTNQYLVDLSPSTPANINNDIPMFIMHGDEDALVPFSQADSMYNAMVSAYGAPSCNESDFDCHLKKKIYSNCGHGWIGGNCQKGTIMNDMVKWFKAH